MYSVASQTHALTLLRGTQRTKMANLEILSKNRFKVLYIQIWKSSTRIWNQISIPFSNLRVIGLQSLPSRDNWWLRHHITVRTEILVGVISPQEYMDCVWQVDKVSYFLELGNNLNTTRQIVAVWLKSPPIWRTVLPFKPKSWIGNQCFFFQN